MVAVFDPVPFDTIAELEVLVTVTVVVPADPHPVRTSATPTPSPRSIFTPGSLSARHAARAHLIGRLWQSGKFIS